jgi:hypothetical protein
MPTGIKLSSGVVVGQPIPLDAKYGPYLTTTAALSDITSGLRYQGLTVGIVENNAIVEYWFKNGVTNLDFVKKESGGTVQTVNSVLPDSSGNVVLSYANVDAEPALKEVYLVVNPNQTTHLTLSAGPPVSDAVNRRVELSVAYYAGPGSATLILPRLEDGHVLGDTLTISFTAPIDPSETPISLVVQEYTPAGSTYLNTLRTVTTLTVNQIVTLRGYGTGGWFIRDPLHIHDTRYYTKTYIDSNFCNIHAHPTILDFPSIGSLTDLYVATNTQKLYRWANSNSYVEIGGNIGTITSVNGQTGPTVTLSASDVGAATASHTHPASAISDSTGSGRTLLTSNLVGARAHLSLFPSFANRAAFPATGDVDRVYTALDTSKIYVWVSSSSTYVEVSPQVKADWNATSGDAEILNKPSSLPPSAHNHDDLYFNAAVPWTANHTLVDGTRYLAGDVVHSGGRIYRAKFDNESIPVTDPVYWQDLGPGNRLNIDGRDIANIPKADWNATSGASQILNKPALNFAPTNLVGSPIEFVIAASNETPALTAGAAKVTFRAPVAFRLTSVSASVTVAPTGSTLIVDINNGANSALSTKLSIDATEKTSATAATAAVVDTSFRDFTQDAETTIDIDQIGSTVAGAGLKVILGGTRL